MNVIGRTQTEWVWPVVFVPKKDVNLRIWVAYRKFNDITVRYLYPDPKMDECLDFFGDTEIFSTLNANSSYWQIELDKTNWEKTAFTLHHGLYQFSGLPYGS